MTAPEERPISSANEPGFTCWISTPWTPLLANCCGTIHRGDAKLVRSGLFFASRPVFIRCVVLSGECAYGLGAICNADSCGLLLPVRR